MRIKLLPTRVLPNQTVADQGVAEEVLAARCRESQGSAKMLRENCWLEHVGPVGSGISVFPDRCHEKSRCSRGERQHRGRKFRLLRLQITTLKRSLI